MGLAQAQANALAQSSAASDAAAQAATPPADTTPPDSTPIASEPTQSGLGAGEEQAPGNLPARALNAPPQDAPASTMQASAQAAEGQQAGAQALPDDQTPLYSGDTQEQKDQTAQAGSTASNSGPFKDAVTGSPLETASDLVKNDLLHQVAQAKHQVKENWAKKEETEKAELKEAPKNTEKKDFLSNLFRGIGEFPKDLHYAANGLGTGVAQTIDTARALGYALHHEPGEAFDSLTAKIEGEQPPEELKSPYYQGGKLAGQAASYGEAAALTGGAAGAGLEAAGVAAPAAGTALGAGAVLAEGGAGNAAFDLQEQLKSKGTMDKVDPLEVGLSGAIGTVLAAAGIGAGARINKEIENRAEKAIASTMKGAMEGAGAKAEELTKEAIAATEAGGRVFDAAMEKLGKMAKEDEALVHQIMHGVIREAQKIENEGAAKVAETLRPEPPTSSLELAQKQILDQIDDAYDTIEKGVEEVGKEAFEAATNVLQAAGVNPQGYFRRNLRGAAYRGFGALTDSIPWKEAKDFLSAELFKSASKVLKDVGEKKAALMHANIEEQAYIKHAFDLAKTPEELGAIAEHSTEELNSLGAAKLAEGKSEQTQLQREHNIAQVQAQMARLQAQITNAGNSPKKEAFLLETIRQLDERLQRLTNPVMEFIEKNGAKQEEHLYNLAHPEHFKLESAKSRGSEFKNGMADNFHDALVQAHHMVRLAAKAESELKEAAKKALPIMQQVKKAWGEHTGNEIDSPSFKTEISHPYNGKVTTEMMTHVRFNSTTEELFGQFLKEHNKLKESLLKQIGMVTAKVTHKIINGLPVKESRDRANQLLRMAMRPENKHMLRAALFGVGAAGSMMGSQAQAAEIAQQDQPHQKDFWTNISSLAAPVGVGIAGAVFLGVATKHFNLAGAVKYLHTPSFVFHYFTNMTSAWTTMSDKSMGLLSGYAQETLPLAERSLTQSLNDLRVAYAKANTFAKDNKQMFIRSAEGELDGRHLSDSGKELLAEVQQAEKDVEKLVRSYGPRWDKHYASLPPQLKAKLQAADGAVRFIHMAYSNLPSKEPADAWFAQGYRSSCRTLFVSNPKNILAATLCDAASGSILRNGIIATMRAYRDVIFDPVVGQAVERMSLPGPRTAGTELKAIAAENFVKNISMAASGAKYFVEHQDYLKAHGINSYPELLDKLTLDKLPSQMTNDLFGRITGDLMRVGGHDFLNLEKSFLERSQRLNGLVNFTGAPMREAAQWKENLQLIVTNFAEGQYASGFQRVGWLMAATAVKQQFAGKAALPASSVALGLSNPITAEATAKLCDLLETWSLGTRTLGDMSDTVNGDMMFAPFLGIVGSPGFEELMNAMTNTQGLLTKVGKVGTALETEHPEDLVTGTRFDKDMQEARDAITEFMDSWSFIKPTIMGVPTMGIAALYKALPDIVNAEGRFGVKRPGLQQSPFMLEQSHARTPVAQVDEEGKPTESQDEADVRARYGAVLRALRLGIPYDQSKYMMYRQAEAAAAAGGDADELARLQADEATTGWAGAPLKARVSNEE